MQRAVSALASFCGAIATMLAVAEAADFSIQRFSGDDGTPIAIIAVDGDLEWGDEKKFINVALTAPDLTYVALNSPGGSALAGIEIGKAIRLKSFKTVVPQDILCASACAIAWLAGTPRYMAPGARIGFHAAFDKTNGEASSVANAAVGAYLNQINLGLPAIAYITSASPTDMKWLTFEDAEKVGIDVRPFETAEGDPTTAESDRRGAPASFPPMGYAVPSPSPGQTIRGEWIQLASRASMAEAIRVARDVRVQGRTPVVFRYDNGWFVVALGPFASGTSDRLLQRLLRTDAIPHDSFVSQGHHYVEVVWGGSSGTTAASDGTAEALAAAQAFFAKSSAPSRDALTYLYRLYPDRMMYFGRLTAKSAVMEDKANFFARWPERLYTIEPGSITVGCRPDGSCLVSGLVNWRAHSRKLNKTSVGTARFQLVFMGPGASQLVAESSDVLNRTRYPGVTAGR